MWKYTDSSEQCVSNGKGTSIPVANVAAFKREVQQWLDAGNVLIHYVQPVAEAAAERIEELHQACRAHAYGGFQCDVLGAMHTYPSQNSEQHPDQHNLNGVVTESLLEAANTAWTTPFWCADANGAWARRDHDHAQIQAVGRALAMHVRDAQTRVAQLVAQVEAIAGGNVLNGDGSAMTDDDKRAAIAAVVW